jgi:hypothetical protein
MKKIKLLILPVVLFTAVLPGCKKDYLDTVPTDRVPQSEIFGTTARISLALNGMYQNMFAFAPNGSGRHDNYGQKSWDLSNDLMGIDMVVHTQGYGWYNAAYQYVEFLQEVDARQSKNAWDYYYIIIGQANTIGYAGLCLLFSCQLLATGI